MDLLERRPSTIHSALYDVAGFQIRVGVDSPDLLEETHSLLGSFHVETLPSPAWRLVAQRAEWGASDQPGAELRPIWSGPVAPNLQGVNYVGPGLRRLELLDRGRLDLDLRAREARLTLATHSRATVAGYFLMPLLCEGLIQAGHQPVHAACLAVSCGGQPRSVLIVAKSGTGKSTTALALADAGWRLMGDDLALVGKRDDRVMAWGFPRMVHVRRPTLDLLPWLNDLPLTPTSLEGTFDLRLSALGRRAWEPRAQLLEPALLIILDRPNRVEHRCERLDRAVALAALAEENVQPIEGCTDANAQTAFVRFAELVQRTPAYRLSVGPRLDGLATFLADQTGVGP